MLLGNSRRWVCGSLQNIPAKKEKVCPPVRPPSRVQGLLSTGAQVFGECLPQGQDRHSDQGRERGEQWGEVALAQTGAPAKARRARGGGGSLLGAASPQPPGGVALSWDPRGSSRGKGLLGWPLQFCLGTGHLPFGKSGSGCAHEALAESLRTAGRKQGSRRLRSSLLSTRSAR